MHSDSSRLKFSLQSRVGGRKLECKAENHHQQPPADCLDGARSLVLWVAANDLLAKAFVRPVEGALPVARVMCPTGNNPEDS
jgi:hypothetical protein